MQENNLETHLYTYTDGGDKNSDDLEYMRIEVELEERVTSRAVDAQERSGARQGGAHAASSHPDRGVYKLPTLPTSLLSLPTPVQYLLASWDIKGSPLGHRNLSGPCNLAFRSSHAFRRYLSVMPLRWRGLMGMSCSTHSTAPYQSRWLLLALTTIWLATANAMTQARIAELRQETVAMFYHGFDNYMRVAFPEDEAGYPGDLRTPLLTSS
jgi:hypothetical protein